MSFGKPLPGSKVKMIFSEGISIKDAIAMGCAAATAGNKAVIISNGNRDVTCQPGDSPEGIMGGLKFKKQNENISEFENSIFIESFFLSEELTDGEVDSLETGNAVVDPGLNTYKIKSVRRDDNGDVVLIKLVAFEAPDDEGGETEEITLKLTPQEIRKYDLA